VLVREAASGPAEAAPHPEVDAGGPTLYVRPMRANSTCDNPKKACDIPNKACSTCRASDARAGSEQFTSLQKDAHGKENERVEARSEPFAGSRDLTESHPRRAMWQAELRLRSPRARLQQVMVAAPCAPPGPFLAELSARTCLRIGRLRVAALCE